MDAKMVFQSARAFMKNTDLGFQETADIAMKGMSITKDVSELNFILRKMAQISFNSVVAVMMIFTMKYVGPKLFYPYLLLEPLVCEESDGAFLSTSHGLMVHTFDQTNYSFTVDTPRANMQLVLHGPSVIFQSFEFKTKHFDSVLTGSIKIDIGRMVVETNTEHSLANCFLKMLKIEVVCMDDFSSKMFIDSDPSISAPLSERLADYLDGHLQDMLKSRIQSAVIERFNRFPAGRALLNCSAMIPVIPES